MFLGLKKVKKFKPAKAQTAEQKVVFPADYLFWAEREVVSNNAGIDYVYIQRECFLGNTDESRVEKGKKGDAFAMRKLTGESAGELFFPELRAGYFYIKVPLNGGDVEYELVVEKFALGNKVADHYSLGEIETFAMAENKKAEQLSKEETNKLLKQISQKRAR